MVETSFQIWLNSQLGRDSEPNLTLTLTQNVKNKDLPIDGGERNNLWLN